MFKDRDVWDISGMVISLLGFVDAVYLTLNKLTAGVVYCGDIGDCNAVNASAYAEIFGIPIALLGAGAYAAIAALLILEGRHDNWRDITPVAFFVITFSGAIYSAFLTYVEFFVLHQICIYCLVSAVFMVVLFGLSLRKILRMP